MTDSTTRTQTPARTRAERRRIIESIRALRRLLDKRHAFEVADRRRLNRERAERDRTNAAHTEALRRIAETQVQREQSLAQRLADLDGRREQQEAQALAVLRREFVGKRLRNTRITPSELNGIGAGLIRDLAAQGITTAADFTRVTWEKAPNGKGGDVVYIHRADGHRVHVNGIGQHRSRPLMEWRQAAVARAEARAPRKLPPDERHRISEIVEAERARLRAESADAARRADTARAEAARHHTAALELLGVAERDAARLAAERRAEFDRMAEQLLALQAELSAHMDRHGDAGRRVRRAQTRALRPIAAPGPAAATGTSPADAYTPTLPGIPSPRQPVALVPRTGFAPAPAPVPSPASPPADGARARPGWLLPVIYFGFTTVVGVGELGASTAPLWLMISSRLLALGAAAELLRLWIPRRSRRRPGTMPYGIGFQSFGVFLALAAAGMFADDGSGVFVAACVVSVLSALFVLAGTGLRIRTTEPVRPS